MQIIKKVMDFVIKDIELSTRNPAIRIILTIFIIVVTLSGFHIISEKHYASVQIQNINYQFKHKDPSLMEKIMVNCDGNLSDQNVIIGCLDQAREQMLSPLSKKLNWKRLQLVIWFIFTFVFVAGYFLLVVKQKTYRKNLKVSVSQP